MQTKRLIAPLLGVAALAAIFGGHPPTNAQQSAPAAAAPAAKPVPGVFQGRVTTADGRPVAGAEINIQGLTTAGQATAIIVYTKADGTYKTHLPPGNYHVAWAWAHVNGYAGKDWRLPLATDPINTSDQDISDGVVADLRLLVQGRTAKGTDPDSPGAYYGGNINVIATGRFEYTGAADSGFPNGSSLELTLTPQGPLLDGSAGKTLVLSAPTTSINYKDIPLGQYAVTGRLVKADGTADSVKIGARLQDLGSSTGYQDSQVIVFQQGGVPGINDHSSDTLLLWVR